MDSFLFRRLHRIGRSDAVANRQGGSSLIQPTAGPVDP
jgi:hypothetical protein